MGDGPRGVAYDLKGRRFGRLTVVRDSSERSKQREIIWLCQCECGKDALVRTSGLMGTTKSCGCLQREATIARNRASGRGSTR